MKLSFAAVLLLAPAFRDDDFVIVGPALNASWIWAADGVKIRRSGAGQYDGFPVEKDAARPGEAIVVVDVSEAPAAGVFHAGFAFTSDYKPVDCSRFGEKGVLEFWVRGERGGEDVEMGLYGAGADGSKQMSIVALSGYAKVTQAWSRVRIPIQDLLVKTPKFDLSRANQIAFHSLPGKTAMKLRFAGIRMTRAPAEIPEKK
jgi:carbohydrate binding protein with CBM30 domain